MSVRPALKTLTVKLTAEAIAHCHTCQSILPNYERGKERICVSCRRRRGREHYRRNRDYYLRKARAQRSASLARSWEYVWEYLTRHSCVDCGMPDPRALEFDHRDRHDKRASVAVLVAEGYGVAAIAEEIAKCDVHCANCHTIKTREEAGWFRSNAWRARRDSNSQPSDP